MANVLAIALASEWRLSIAERLVVFLGPPLAFLLAVTIATAVAGHERIVFYQAALGAVATTICVGAALRLRIPTLVDVVTLGIGTFLIFGRVGCFAVACCHGTLGRGVVYGPAHVALGFWKRWSGRSLWPVQLVESAASLVLVVVAVLWAKRPGDATAMYASGYAVVRFALELVRGDAPRAYVRGVSEAQWLSLLTAIIAAVWHSSVVRIAVAGALAMTTLALVLRRRQRELLLPPHLHELDRLIASLSRGTRAETSLGIAISTHNLPDGRVDWVLSSAHPTWNEAMARRLAHALWQSSEIVPGRSAGVIHILTRPPPEAEGVVSKPA